jgi:aminoglycoside 2''-phosphotransferase
MDSIDYKEIVDSCFPELRAYSAELVAEGWDSLALEVGGTYIFRFPKRPDVEPQYLKEERLLEALADRLPAPIPRFDYVWPGGRSFPMRFVGYPKLGGVAFDSLHWSTTQSTSLAAQLGAFLSALHRFPIQHAIALLPPADTTPWRDRYTELYEQVRARVLPLLDASEQHAVRDLWDRLLEELTRGDFKPAVLHCDLSMNHILCEPKNVTLSGVIDWGDARLGDPAFDFVGLLAGDKATFAEQTLAAYSGAIDTAFRRRMQFYARVIPFHELLFGVETGIATHVQQGLADVRRDLRGEGRVTNDE